MMNRSDDTTKSPIQYPLVIGFVLHSAVLQWPSGSSPTRLSIRDHDLNGTFLFPSSPAYNFTLDSGCKITGPTHAERSVFAYCVTCVKPLSTHTHTSVSIGADPTKYTIDSTHPLWLCCGGAFDVCAVRLKRDQVWPGSAFSQKHWNCLSLSLRT